MMLDLLGMDMELDDTSLGAFVHTSHAALEEAFQFAGVTSESCVIDIGCGDGRAAIVAAAKFHCHAVGGIDCGAELIDKFVSRANNCPAIGGGGAAGTTAASKPCTIAADIVSADAAACVDAASPPSVDAPQLSKCFCVCGDALAWGSQQKMFLSEKELSVVQPGTVVHATPDAHTGGSKEEVLLPTPTHVYLYILQHKLKYLVPLLKRIRAEVPGVVIVSAFAFKERRPPTPPGATAIPATNGVPLHDNEEEEDYLDVPVAATLLESKGHLTFRVYK